jgi:hypothetical protein
VEKQIRIKLHIDRQVLGMTIFLVRTYIVKHDKVKEHDTWGKKLVTLMKKQPDKFDGVKSMQVLSPKYGESVGRYTAMWKFAGLTDADKWEDSFGVDGELATLRAELMDLIVPGSYSASIWESVKTLNRRNPKLKSTKKRA